ncbi:hypothetical protein MSPP1_000585 [Malassezia sp. CBS 17886]|nr:hypothetical protein MSPP1_000585 [Malassezia sp. CBS 17886]
MKRHSPYGGYEDSARPSRRNMHGGGRGPPRGRAAPARAAGADPRTGYGSHSAEPPSMGVSFPGWGGAFPTPMYPGVGGALLGMPPMDFAFGGGFPSDALPAMYGATPWPMSPYGGAAPGPSGPPGMYEAPAGAHGEPRPRGGAPRRQRQGDRSSEPRRGGRSRSGRPSRSLYQPDPDAERPEDSKPCRTLFVRNVVFEVDPAQLRAEFQSFGDVKVWFDLIPRRGMVFVTYYDTRAAENAKVQMNGKILGGRTMDVHFSLPKDADHQQHCDREKNQGTLFLEVLDATAPLTDDLVRETASRFGELREVRTYQKRDHARFVEFWDSRACVAAHDALDGSPLLGGRLALKFAWDLATVSLEAKAAAETRSRRDEASPAPRRAPVHNVPPSPWGARASGSDAGSTENRLEQAQKVQQGGGGGEDRNEDGGVRGNGGPPRTRPDDAAAHSAAHAEGSPGADAKRATPAPLPASASSDVMAGLPIPLESLQELLRHAQGAVGPSTDAAAPSAQP